MFISESTEAVIVITISPCTWLSQMISVSLMDHNTNTLYCFNGEARKWQSVSQNSSTVYMTWTSSPVREQKWPSVALACPLLLLLSSPQHSLSRSLSPQCLWELPVGTMGYESLWGWGGAMKWIYGPQWDLRFLHIFPMSFSGRVISNKQISCL